MWEVSLSDKRKISAKPKVVQIEDNTKKNPFFSFIVEMPPTFDEVKVTIKRVKNVFEFILSFSRAVWWAETPCQTAFREVSLSFLQQMAENFIIYFLIYYFFEK